MEAPDIDEAERTLQKLLELALRSFRDVNTVGPDFAQLEPWERDLYLHLKDHVFAAGHQHFAIRRPATARALDLLHSGTITLDQWNLIAYVETFPSREKTITLGQLAQRTEHTTDKLLFDLDALDRHGLLTDDMKAAITDREL